VQGRGRKESEGGARKALEQCEQAGVVEGDRATGPGSWGTGGPASQPTWRGPGKQRCLAVGYPPFEIADGAILIVRDIRATEIAVSQFEAQVAGRDFDRSREQGGDLVGNLLLTLFLLTTEGHQLPSS
jgi:hypothetical protein